MTETKRGEDLQTTQQEDPNDSKLPRGTYLQLPQTWNGQQQHRNIREDVERSKAVRKGILIETPATSLDRFVPKIRGGHAGKYDTKDS